MPQPEEVSHHVVGAATVLDRERVIAVTGDRTVEQNGRQVGGDVRDHGSRVQMRRHRDEPIHPASHRTQRRLELLLGIARAGNEEVIAALPGGLIHTTDQLGVKLAVQLRQQRSDRVGRTRNEASCNPVRSVP
jgi:hypothetical protein